MSSPKRQEVGPLPSGQGFLGSGLYHARVVATCLTHLPGTNCDKEPRTLRKLVMPPLNPSTTLGSDIHSDVDIKYTCYVYVPDTSERPEAS